MLMQLTKDKTATDPYKIDMIDVYDDVHVLF